jgi:predicted dehydrogenase
VFLREKFDILGRSDPRRDGRYTVNAWERPANGDPVRWGILGTGYIAEQFAADIARSHTGPLAAVASRDAARAAVFGERHGATTTHGSYESLVAAPDVDCVYVALPNNLHLEWVERAAEAGKHILCEKPLGLDAEQAGQAFATAERNGVLLLEGFMFRMHPQIATLVELLREGAIGEPRVLEASFGGNMHGGLENFRMQRRMGGGSLLDLGCYGVSLARLVAGVQVGQRFADPSSVRAVGRIGGRSGVDEWTAAVLGFDEGLVASVVCGNQVDIPSVARIWGDRGNVVLESPWQPGVGGRRPALLVQRDAPDTAEEIVVPSDRPLYALEVDAFADCLALGRVPFPLMDAADTLGNMRTLDAWRQEIGLEFNG